MTDESTPGDAGIGTQSKQSDAIRVGTFRLNGDIKYYAIVKGSDMNSHYCLKDIREYWGLPNPGFLLQTNSSNAHRDAIISPENACIILNGIFKKGVDVEMFKNDKSQEGGGGGGGPTDRTGASDGQEDAEMGNIDAKNSLKNGSNEKSQAEEGGGPTDRTGASDGQEEDAEMGNIDDGQEDVEMGNIGAKKSHEIYLEQNLPWMSAFENDWVWVNRYLQRKIIHTLSSIVSACDMTNGWIICQGPPSVNEKMLEAAMAMTGSSPTILVVDCFDKYTGDTKELSKLDTNARPMYSENHPDKLEFNAMKDTYGIVHKSTSFEAGRTLWKQDTPQNWKPAFPWSHGTHFIFSDNHKDFDPRLLGPTGFLCMHGNAISKDETADHKRTGYIIRDCIMTVKPCLLFDNSGGETQAYARLIRRIKEKDRVNRVTYKEKKSKEREERAKAVEAKWFSFRKGERKGRMLLERAWSRRLPSWMPNEAVQGESEEEKKPDYFEDFKLTLRHEVWELIEYANRGHTLTARNALNLADVIQIVDMYCSNPRLFRKIVVPVDPLNDSPDEIVKVMTLSFARASTEVREVGAGNADKNCVEQAWRLHEQLDWSKIMKNYQRQFLYFLYILSGFSTVLVAVLNQMFDTTYSDVATKWATVTLASTVSLCGGILYLISADAQVNKITNAQARIIEELFLFRMRVGKYSLSVHERALDNNNAGDPSINTTSKARRGPGDQPKPRSQRNHGNASAAMHASRELFSARLSVIAQDLSSLDLYPSKLYLDGEIDDSHDREYFETYAGEQLHLPPWLEVKPDVAFSGGMSPEEYYKIRVQSMLIMLEAEEDMLRNITRGLQITSMIFSSAAVVLGSAGIIEPIPVVIAGATGIHQILKVGDYERRFEIVSSAARELRGLDGHWCSLSDLDHQMRDSIVHVVSTCEQLVFQYVTKSAIQVDKAPMGMTQGKEETK